MTVDAYIIRIWERPYFELAFDPSYYEFQSLRSSVWYTIISMASVGYGNIVASTHIGRACAFLAIINGAFLLALLVGLIIDWFKLDSNKIQTLNKISEERLAIKSVKAALDYNIAKQKRVRYLR